jgi:hypothetical protein
MKKAIIIYLVFLALAFALYGGCCWSYNPRDRWGDALLIEEMDSIGLPDTLHTVEYTNLMNRVDHDNYQAVIYFKESLSDSAIFKMDSLVEKSTHFNDGYNVWNSSSDTIQLIPDKYITDQLDWVKTKDVLYYHFNGGLDASITYWIYEDTIIADAESSKFPNRLLDAGFLMLLLYIFLPWALLLGFIKLLKFFERDDKARGQNQNKKNDSSSSARK